MKKLKGIILGIDKVLVTKGVSDKNLMNEIGHLTKYLLSRNITPVVLANRAWKMGGMPLEDALRETLGDFPWFIANRDGFPHKPKAASITHVLSKMGWDSAEVIYLGNTKDDMRTAVNGKVLFLNGIWYEKTVDYGFECATPKDVAKFVDIFCLRDHLWHYSINDGVEFYALAPYATREREFSKYSTDAKNAAKFGGGHTDFWTKYLISTIYFSELHKRINYIAPYPGHLMASKPNVIEEPMLIFSKCFRQIYLRDLIIRHTDTEKSAFIRSRGERPIQTTQLNSIRLNENPLNGTGSQIKCPLGTEKTVLMVDDICTNGFSLEAARYYISQTGAKTICLSWLKTIRSNYQRINSLPKFNPFVPNTFLSGFSVTEIPYEQGITDVLAAGELDQKLEEYSSWDWPE